MIRLKELLTQLVEKRAARMAEAMRRLAPSPEMEKQGKTQGLELPGAIVGTPSTFDADKRSGMQDKPTDAPPSSSPKPVVSANPDMIAAKERKAKRDAEIIAAAKAEFEKAMASKKDTNVSPKTGKDTGTALPQIDELEDTLKSYLKKAKRSAESELRKSDEREDKAMSTDGEKYPERQQNHVERAKEHFKKYQKRQKGISTASNKMGNK
jgi:hypothetical protein